MQDLDARQREILRRLWYKGRMSRWQLHLDMKLNPNAVGADVAELLEKGIIREGATEPRGPGRPQVPLEIDPNIRHVIGLAIAPGKVETGRINLRGQPTGTVVSRQVQEPARIVSEAAELLRECLDEDTLAVGVSSTGLVDPITREILFSSSLPGQGVASLAPLYEAAAAHPLVLENNMHALAARWLLNHQAPADQDVLLVQFTDGQLGAALLIGGRPNRGCATGSNELGHTRFFVETDVCYCGHPGCLERICSTPFLRRLGVGEGTLVEYAGRFRADPPGDEAIRTVLDYLSAGISNAVNFIRPNRLVLVSELLDHAAFRDQLFEGIRSRTLTELAQRVQIQTWDQVDSRSAETAGWLALASLYREGWIFTTSQA